MSKDTSTNQLAAMPSQFNPESAEALNLLKNRRSVVAKSLGSPGPTEDQLKEILQIGTRVPDHGKLAPWRFVIFEGNARQEFGAKLAEVFERDEPKADADRVAFEAGRFMRAPTVVAVVSSPSRERPIPLWEQHLSAAAVCQNMLIASTAMGFGAQWLTEWYAYHTEITDFLGLQEDEQIAGFIYIGTTQADLMERARPELDALMTYWSSQQKTVANS